MENKQTAVEWLFEQIEDSVNGRCEWEGKWHSLEDTKQKALELEKEQHKETWFSSTTQFDNAAEMTYKKDFEQYYSETYKTEPDGK